MTKEAYWGLLCRSKFVRSSATPMTCGAPGSSRSLANLRCARCLRAQGETNARPPARQGASKVRPGHRQTMGPLWGLNSLSFPLIHFKTSKLYARAAARLNAGGVSNGITKVAFFGHQKYLVRTTCSAVVGKCLKVRTAARLYEAQSHGVSAYHAWHLNGGSKACAGWRWAGDLHCILIFKGGTQRYRRQHG